MPQDSHAYKKDLREMIKNLPESPGVYHYYDQNGVVIYVGKAKNLKRRVGSYFNKEQENAKTRILVSKICDIKYIVVRTEEDALLLENNLIKKHQPRYNVLLKDDKTYPSICVSNEYFPRVYSTRQIPKNGSTYFGPYSHVQTMYTLLEIIKKVYHVRRCLTDLDPAKIAAGKFKTCLEYHIHNCHAPCVGKQSHNAYMQEISEIKHLLAGNTRELITKLRAEMLGQAEELRFEEAEQTKKKLIILQNYQAKSEIVPRTLNNIDVFTICNDEERAIINYLHITEGCINQAYTFSYKKKLNESKEELLIMGIAEMRIKYQSTAREIIVPFEIDLELPNVAITIPQKGDKKRLLDLSMLNVQEHKVYLLRQSDKLNPEQRGMRLMKELQNLLQLKDLPMHIECFDNSNISGKDAVAGCVVFRQCKPSKKDYQKFYIKTVPGPDDYASMREVVYRRNSRMISEGSPLPDLIIADGGKGQMEAIRSVIENKMHLQIAIVGLAKNQKHKTHEVLFGNPAATIGLKPNSELFHFFEKVQEEVHRYAITFHRNVRSKRQVNSELDEIKGIGPKTKESLLKALKSTKRIKEATFDELTAIVGKGKAEIIHQYLHQNHQSE